MYTICMYVEKLIKRHTDFEESPIYYVSIEDNFDVIKRVHISTGHGGRDRMLKALSSKYANITVWAVEHFQSFCIECQRKSNGPWWKVLLSDEYRQGSSILVDK